MTDDNFADFEEQLADTPDPFAERYTMAEVPQWEIDHIFELFAHLCTHVESHLAIAREHGNGSHVAYTMANGCSLQVQAKGNEVLTRFVAPPDVIDRAIRHHWVQP